MYNKFIKKDGEVLLDLTEDTVESSSVLEGVTAHNRSGEKVIGTIPDNGTINSTMDGISTKSITIPSGYTSGGKVSLDDTIDNEVNTQADLITQIMNVLDSKTGYNTIYIGNSVPSNDFGINGDIYIVRGDA